MSACFLFALYLFDDRIPFVVCAVATPVDPICRLSKSILLEPEAERSFLRTLTCVVENTKHSEETR